MSSTTQDDRCDSDGLSTPVALLLVEDEASIRAILEDCLGELGFDLNVKANGALAIAELNADAGLYHALITDIRLGDGPSGWDVARHARELNPNIPVIYMSGDSAEDWAAQGSRTAS